MRSEPEALDDHWITAVARRVSGGEDVSSVLREFGYALDASMVKRSKNFLTAQEVRDVLEYDPETGRLVHRVTRVGITKGRSAGYKNYRGYIEVRIFGHLYRAHRVAWLIHYGEWPVGEIDHINGDKTDNRIANLRCVSGLENNQNLGYLRRDNTSGFPGVRKNGSGWNADIRVNRTRIYLGTFNTPEEASSAYLQAKASLHVGATDAAIEKLKARTV